MAEQKLTEKAWNEYLESVYGGRVAECQIPELRMAFYAGATALFCEMGVLNPSGKIDDEKLIQKIESIKRELIEWNNEIGQIVEAKKPRI